jgi:hypothetical protein
MTPHNPNSRIHAWTPPRSRYGFIQIRAPITRSRKIHSSAYSSPISRRLRSSKLHNISQSYTAAPPRRRYPAQVRCSTYLERGEVDNHRQRFRGDHAWAYIRSTPVSRPQAANQTYAVYAFDLIELDGEDMRRDPLLASLLRRAAPGLRFNEHLDEEDGPLVFAHACKMSSVPGGDGVQAPAAGREATRP